jgi:hypothetical protein
MGDVLTLSLPGFNSSGGSGVVNTLGISNSSFRVFWDRCAQKVFLTAIAPVASHAPQQLILPESVGVQLPRQGIPANDPNLILSTNAMAGAAYRSINTTQPVFSFSSGPLFTYDPAIAGRGTDLLINFTAFMDLLADDTVTFMLPGFVGTGSDFLPVSDLNSSFVKSARWQQSSQQLTLQFNSTVTRGTPVSVSLPNRTIALPVRGVAGNSATLKTAVNAVSGTLVDFEVQTSPAVGSFTNTVAVRFSPPRAGSVTSIILFFTPEMSILPAETIQLEIANLFGNNATLSTFTETTGSVSLRTATWSEGKLSLTLLNGISARATASIVVPADMGIKIPTVGLRANTLFKISTQAVLGPVLPLVVTDFVPIGGKHI